MTCPTARCDTGCPPETGRIERDELQWPPEMVQTLLQMTDETCREKIGSFESGSFGRKKERYMKAFFDTSSILKQYHNEEGSAELEDYFNKNIDIHVLSELADLEFRSALWRKVRMEEINEQIAV